MLTTPVPKSLCECGHETDLCTSLHGKHAPKPGDPTVCIRCGRVTYFGSQPWPFPTSLMIGAHAEAVTHDIVVDRDEERDIVEAAIRGVDR